MFRFKEVYLKMLNRCIRPYSSRGRQRPVPAVPSTMVSALPNGMRIATEISSSPLACIALFVEVGPVCETPANHGITHFIEHMAYRGFQSMDKQQLENCLASMGAKMSVTTTREFQVFSAQCSVANACEIVSILAKIVTELKLSDAEMEIAKCMIDLESFETEKNPKAVVSDYLHETAFQGTPLGRRIIGPTKNVTKFVKNDVVSYMKENYYPSRFLLATSGAVNHDCMVSSASRYFGNIEKTCDSNYSPPRRFTGSQILYRDDSMKFAHVAIAVEAPGMRGSDFVTMLVASNIMGSWSKSQGGHNRHGSPLARAAATSSLCDSFEPFYITYRHVGLWGMYMSAGRLDIDDILHNVQDRWVHLCTTTVLNDVERGINVTKLELMKKIEGSVKSCYDIGMQVIYNSERKTLLDIYEELSNINEKKIKAVVSKYVYDKCPAVSGIGPVEALQDYTRIRAAMYWLRL